MKVILSLMLVLILGHIADAQTRAISKSDYDAVFDSAGLATNSAFPFVFTVITDTYESGKVVSTETDIDERQTQGVERETKMLLKDGKTLRSFSVMVGVGNNTYCSADGTSWRGPQQYVCPGAPMVRVFGGCTEREHLRPSNTRSRTRPSMAKR